MAELTFNDFKRLASDNSLSSIEKIGFPENYRKGFEEAIVRDICLKTGLNERKNQIVIDIGCGCSEMVWLLINECKNQNHQLYLIDSKEMLDQLPDDNRYTKIEGRFPDVIGNLEHLLNKSDIIICYSVFHYIFAEMNSLHFIHQAISLLKSSGKLLIGDIPNVSKRDRFLNSEAGRKFSDNFATGKQRGSTEHEDRTLKIDDSIIASIINRFRAFECETYLVPQPSDLPMSNRREDILIEKR